MKLLYSVIANVLASVQDSPWWQEHLKKEEEKKWKQLRDDMCSGIVSHMHGLIDNAVSYKKQMLSATSNQIKQEVDFAKVRHELTMTAKVVKQMEKIRRFMGVQGMSGPVGLAYHMGRVQQNDDDISPRQISLEITKHTVTAGTRKLCTRWGIEAMQDMKVSHPDLDWAHEITSVISFEVFNEIMNEMVYKMGQAAGLKTEATLDNLEATIRDADRDIFMSTGRLKASFIIAGPESALKLSESVNFKVCEKEEVGSLTLIGKLSEMEVWTHPYSGNKVLVGAKGDSDADSGLIYCPYVPLMMSGVVVDPNTFQPHMTTMTRYGLSHNETATYYALITVG